MWCDGGGLDLHNSPAFDEFTDIKCDGDGDPGVMRSDQFCTVCHLTLTDWWYTVGHVLSYIRSYHHHHHHIRSHPGRPTSQSGLLVVAVAAQQEVELQTANCGQNFHLIGLSFKYLTQDNYHRKKRPPFLVLKVLRKIRETAIKFQCSHQGCEIRLVMEQKKSQHKSVWLAGVLILEFKLWTEEAVVNLQLVTVWSCGRRAKSGREISFNQDFSSSNLDVAS